ncbi:MAG: hypothetical protein ACLFPE_00105 [Bacteroidales bacterium]
MHTLHKAFQEVFSDKQSGSAAVLQKLIDVLDHWLMTYNRPQSAAGDLKERLPELHEKLGHFAVVAHFLDALEDFLNSPESDADNSPANFLEGYRNKWKNVNADIAVRAVRSLDLSGKTIMLHSNSSALVEVFRRMTANGWPAEIIQTESRPACEGRQQAEAIARLGFVVRFITDSAIGLYLSGADMVLCGADQIGRDGFVNKTGTYPLALMCREYMIPFYVLADSRKMLGRMLDREKLRQPSNPPEEIWKTEHPNIYPQNYYFECIPNSLVCGFITEKRFIRAGSFT